MKIREIIAQTAEVVENKELAEIIRSAEEDGDEDAAAKAALLLRGFYFAERNIAYDYEPQKRTIPVNGGRVYYSDLGVSVIKILRAVGKGGGELGFSAHADYVDTPSDTAAIEIYCCPAEDGMDGDFLYENCRIGKLAFVYATAAEYCMLCGRYDEAENFDAKFRRSAERTPKFSSRRIKARRDWGL